MPSTVVIDADGQLPYGVGALGSVILLDPETGEPYVPGTISNEQIEEIVADYLAENPPEGVTSYNDLTDKPDLGTAAASDVEDFATAAQGGLADSAIQSSDLSLVATTGLYTDLGSLPTLGTAAASSTTDFVSSSRTVNGHSLGSNVTVTASDVGLDEVDNTADEDKPVSTAQALSIGEKLQLSLSRPIVRYTSSSLHPSRSSSVPAGYTGPIEYDSTGFTGASDPSDQQVGDWWTERV